MTVPLTCRSCRAPLIEKVLDLGPQPASDHFPAAGSVADDPRWPLELWLCSGCALAQLGTDAAIPEPPLAVESDTMRRHAAAISAVVLEQSGLHAGGTVAEAASHHGGSWLPHLVAGGLTAIPLPADHAVDLLVDVHGIAHEPDTDAVLAAHARSLRPAGRLVLEFHHLLPLVRGGQYDTVRHGHAVYLSLLALQPALLRHGLLATSAAASSAYGGSLRVTARPAGSGAVPDASIERVLTAERAAGIDRPDVLRGLQDRAVDSARSLAEHLEIAHREGRVVLGYGAPSKASVLLCFSGVGPELLPFTADLAAAKWGRRVPGCGVPIRSPQELVDAQPDEVLILVWDIADEIAAQLQPELPAGCRFVVPIPLPHELQPRVVERREVRALDVYG